MYSSGVLIFVVLCASCVQSFLIAPRPLYGLKFGTPASTRSLHCTSQDDAEVADDSSSNADSNPSENDNNGEQVSAEEIRSKEIDRLQARLAEIELQITSTSEELANEKNALTQLNNEFGAEIARIKKEFSRMKERAYEEGMEMSNKAKIDALKEVLPITDNYYRAKQLFEPFQTETEAKIGAHYEEIFKAFSKVIEDFGVTRVESVGQPFDFRFMEAIMTAPSTDYGKDLVSMEYQVGYKMGDKCVRPAMVVVSQGPGPSA